MPQSAPTAPLPHRLYVLYGVACTSAGWGLSLLDLLNPRGFALFSALIAAGAVWMARTRKGSSMARWNWRLRHLFPAAFAALALLALLGGVLHPPSNPDGLTHRVPRLLNWLAEEQWHWIENAPENFNTRATGFEWMMAPIVSITRTDRWVFLLNAWSFLLLPGLVYSVFWRLGVSRRTAWHWMWIVPSGYCFLLQAGSIGNDLAGATITLAAFAFALRATSTRRISDVLYAILAAALMTNAKASNLTLLLPWAVLALPLLGLLIRNPIKTAAVGLIAFIVSLAPNSIFNIVKIGDWSGTSLEAPTFQKLTPTVAFVGNAMNLAAQNFVPPVFPMAGWWNANVHQALPPELLTKLEESFEIGGAHITLMEMQLEVAAGLGFGVCVFLILSIIAVTIKRARQAPCKPQVPWFVTAAKWAAWISLLAYMVKTGLSTSARLIAPYYCLLLPLLLSCPCHARLTRSALWKAGGGLVFLIAAGLLAINPARPLIPAGAIFAKLAREQPESGALAKAALLYESYALRWDALAPIRNHLPPGARNVGFLPFIGSSSIETSLWRPFSERRIWWLRPGTPREEMEQKGIEYVILGADSPDIQKWGVTFSDWLGPWLAENNGEIVAEEPVRLLATGDPKPWKLVRLGKVMPAAIPAPQASPEGSAAMTNSQ